MAYRVGRYEVHQPIALGGMAVVHLGRIVGPVGFSRTVAIKRLHPHLATDPEFVGMFLDEARLAARVQHPNVVPTLDVVASHGQLFLVMDFVLGASLSQLMRDARAGGLEPPPAVVSAIVAGGLYGLHAAHEARDQQGESLGIVHRDVSPQNLLVGTDGVTRVVDFGVAKAAARDASTRDGQLKGKLAYMAPEQILRKSVDRRADVYATGVVLWEAVTLQRLFTAESEGAVIAAVLEGHVRRPSELRRDLPPTIDGIVARALSADPAVRFPTAEDFAAALETAIPPAPQREVAAWVESISGADIDARRAMVSAVERSPAIVGGADDDAVEGLVAPKLSPEEARRLATALTASLPSRRDHAFPVDITSEPVPAPRRRAAGLWVAGGVFATAVTAGAFVAWGRSLPRRDPPPSASVPTAASAPSAIAPSPSEPAPATPVESAPAPAAVATPHRAPPHAPASTRAHTAPSAAGPSCDPPFSLDANGVKRFKPWCL